MPSGFSTSSLQQLGHCTGTLCEHSRCKEQRFRKNTLKSKFHFAPPYPHPHPPPLMFTVGFSPLLIRGNTSHTHSHTAAPKYLSNQAAQKKPHKTKKQTKTPNQEKTAQKKQPSVLQFKQLEEFCINVGVLWLSAPYCCTSTQWPCARNKPKSWWKSREGYKMPGW